MSEPIKVLDATGVKALFDLLSLQDYPNNDVLMAVINAIDNTKADKNEVINLLASKLEKENIFIGTSQEYRTAFALGQISNGTIIILTDVK